MRRSVWGICLFVLAVACSTPPGSPGNDDDDVTSPTPTQPPPGSITYHKDILPVVFDQCVSCHFDGGSGPGAWDDYAITAAYSGVIATYVESRLMPPWPPDPSCGHKFIGERLLTEEQKLTFRWWHDDGAPEGDPADAPTPPPAPDPDHGLGTPDVTMAPGSVTPNFGGGQDLYWCLRLDPGITQDTDFTAVEILPSNLNVVHHALLYREPGGKGQATGAPGFECGGIPGQSSEMLGGWTPGSRPGIFPPGIGMTIASDDALLLQLHYHVPENDPGAATDDASVVKMWFGSVTEKAHTVWTGNPLISIPDGAVDYTVNGTCSIPGNAGDVKLIAIGPHMHNIGSTFSAEVSSGGTDTCLVDIPRWDFEWQGTYQYPSPIILKGGDTIRTTCQFTNNTGSTVEFGEGSKDEMCFGFLTVVGNLSQYCFF